MAWYGLKFQVSLLSIYDWQNFYVFYIKSNKALVVENKSEAYRTKKLARRALELEAALGRKQIEIDMLSKFIELTARQYPIEIKESLIKKG